MPKKGYLTGSHNVLEESVERMSDEGEQETLQIVRLYNDRS
jgi:hypothetical protein